MQLTHLTYFEFIGLYIYTYRDVQKLGWYGLKFSMGPPAHTGNPELWNMDLFICASPLPAIWLCLECLGFNVKFGAFVFGKVSLLSGTSQPRTLH
jgi:hypothetical protein